MHASSSEDFLRPYREAVERYGAGFEATLWNSRDAQHLHFDVMIDLVGLAGGTVLDVGCGPGAFAAHLLQRDVPFEGFIGIDAIAEMVELANAEAYPRCRFEVADAIARPELFDELAPDFVCISGTLNTMDEDVARALIERAYAAASQAVVFNFLSDRPHARRDGVTKPARRFDTLGWLDWAMTKTSAVKLSQAYLDGHDATIAMFAAGDRGSDHLSGEGPS